MKVQINHNLRMDHLDHPLLIQARLQGPEATQQALDLLLERNKGKLPRNEYIHTGTTEAENSLFDDGFMLMLDRLTGVASNAAASFYLALFSSDTTLLAPFNGNFGAVSGGTVTEFTNYDEATRPAITFGAATRSENTYLCTFNSSAEITISTGVTDVTIYGAILTDQSAKQYSAGNGKAIAGARFATLDRPVLSTGQIKQARYQFYGTRGFPGA